MMKSILYIGYRHNRYDPILTKSQVSEHGLYLFQLVDNSYFFGRLRQPAESKRIDIILINIVDILCISGTTPARVGSSCGSVSENGFSRVIVAAIRLTSGYLFGHELRECRAMS